VAWNGMMLVSSSKRNSWFHLGPAKNIGAAGNFCFSPLPLLLLEKKHVSCRLLKFA
jgi:hypothetical protein